MTTKTTRQTPSLLPEKSRWLVWFLLIATCAIETPGTAAPAALDKFSPIGAWEVTLTGPRGDKGYAFLGFLNDQSLACYGMTLNSFGAFTIGGAWVMDSKGNLTAQFIETPGLGILSGSFVGKALHGRRLAGKLITSSGNFTVTGVPVTTTPGTSQAPSH